MTRHLLFAAALVAMASVVSAQNNASSIQGVWKIVEITTTGANAAKNANPQPGLMIFTKGHYSQVNVQGTRPRPAFAPAKDPAKLTDAEKLARFEQWNPFAANSGTYQLTGSTLSRRPLVAKNVTVMTTDSPIVQEVRFEGNNMLWLITKSAAGQPQSETRTKLMRVE
jgi:hypothetical protein